MSFAAAALQTFEGAPIPDALRRAAVGFLVGSAARRMSGAEDIDARFAAEMISRPIAEHVQAANDQHYELPAGFFQRVLGPHLKYSSCLYSPGDDLEAAEARAIATTCRHADLADGQDVLELGCGWGSLSLWMAKSYPGSRITAVSNSRSQGEFIRAEAARRGLPNLNVVTCDMNDFQAAGRYDRVVSVEMFEHMANWRGLLERVRGWLRPDGRAFIHVFTHKTTPYRFDIDDPTDWIAQHFFTGGVMPSHGLMRQFGDLFTVEKDWRWSGENYRHTAEDWLANYDANADSIWPILVQVYGADAKLWSRRWRLFFLATSGLFGHAGGGEWGVSHYRLAPVPEGATR
jgi:cyclopropane-fatty-acyl-phospholipid synthase